MPTSIESLQRQIDALQRRIGPDCHSEQRGEFLAAQARADSMMRAFGSPTAASPPVTGEPLLAYKARLLMPLKGVSKTYKDSDLTKVQCPNFFRVIEESIYADAERVLHDGSTVPYGQMRTIVRQDATGMARFKDYIGKPGACWDKFKLPRQFVKRFGDERTGQDCF